MALALAAVALFAQSGSKSAKKKEPTKQSQPARDPEDRWICRIGSYHDCHCPAMWAEQEDAAIKKCADSSSTHEAYVACLSKVPSHCEMIQVADTAHPEHTCKRTCKAMAGCQCDDAPVCKGPTLQQYGASDEDNQP